MQHEIDYLSKWDIAICDWNNSIFQSIAKQFCWFKILHDLLQNIYDTQNNYDTGSKQLLRNNQRPPQDCWRNKRIARTIFFKNLYAWNYTYKIIKTKMRRLKIKVPKNWRKLILSMFIYFKSNDMLFCMTSSCSF